MRVLDVIFSLAIGRVIGFLMNDFFLEWGIKLGFYYTFILWIVFPFLSLFCLWLAYLIGRKFLFIYQAVKHLLVGAFATVFDLKIFVLLSWFFTSLIFINPLIFKGISFILSTIIKYWGNKYWAFEKHEPFDSLRSDSGQAAQDKQDNVRKEIIQFFYITLFGLIIDISVFYYMTKLMGPQFNLSAVIWIKLSIIFAAIIAALWNFLGYKFLVFKK